jgi:hypothetical protein
MFIIVVIFSILIIAIGASDASATPTAFRTLSILTLIAAIALPVMGVRRLSAFITWWSDLPTWLLRTWLGFALGFGLFTLASSITGPLAH